MRTVTRDELKDILKDKKPDEILTLQETELSDIDLSGWDLSKVDFSLSSFYRVNFDDTNLQGANVSHVLFKDCTLRRADLRLATLICAILRYADMTGCNIEGANLHCAVLEYARLEGIIFNEETKWFGPHCPGSGAFLGYKKCFNGRLVQLLIPADAKRTSSTMNSCRCNKAKVLTIKSFDYKESYEEAWSLVDENFVYRVGKWVEVKDFNEDRWMDSTTGIHFWLTREEAMNY